MKWGLLLVAIGIVLVVIGEVTQGDAATQSALLLSGTMTGVGGLLLIGGSSPSSSGSLDDPGRHSAPRARPRAAESCARCHQSLTSASAAGG